MDFDELQTAWQSQESEPMITVHPDTLLKVVERNKRSFELTIFWRDVGEVGASILVAVACVFFGTIGFGWPFYVFAVSAASVGGFMVIDRIRQKKRTPAFSEPLRTCIERSLSQLNHQVWLSRNVFWWYLLPAGGGMLFAFADCVYLLRPRLWIDLPVFLGLFVLCAAVFWDVYRKNQRAVRKEFLQRKQELEALLDTLKAGKN